MPPAVSTSAARQTKSQPLGRLALLAFITGFSGAIMPGPLLVAVIDKTTRQGITAVAGLIGGHAALEFVLVILLALGLHPLIGKRRVRAAIGLLGGAALFFLGGLMLWNVSCLSLTIKSGSQPDSFLRLMFLGAWISLLNPYFTGWWATVGAGQLAHMAPKTPAEYFSFYLGHEAADFGWYGLVGILIITSRRLLSDAMYRGLIVICAAALLLIAARFVLAGWRLLREK